MTRKSPSHSASNRVPTTLRAGPPSAALSAPSVWARELGKVFRRVAVFAVSGVEARVAAVHGLPSRVVGLERSLSDQTPLRWALEAASPLVAAGSAPGGDLVARMLRIPPPRAFVVVPLVVAGHVVALAYADAEEEALPLGLVGELFEFCHAVLIGRDDDAPRAKSNGPELEEARAASSKRAHARRPRLRAGALRTRLGEDDAWDTGEDATAAEATGAPVAACEAPADGAIEPAALALVAQGPAPEAATPCGHVADALAAELDEDEAEDDALATFTSLVHESMAERFCVEEARAEGAWVLGDHEAFALAPEDRSPPPGDAPHEATRRADSPDELLATAALELERAEAAALELAAAGRVIEAAAAERRAVLEREFARCEASDVPAAATLDDLDVMLEALREPKERPRAAEPRAEARHAAQAPRPEHERLRPEPAGVSFELPAATIVVAAAPAWVTPVVLETPPTLAYTARRGATDTPAEPRDLPLSALHPRGEDTSPPRSERAALGVVTPNGVVTQVQRAPRRRTRLASLAAVSTSAIMALTLVLFAPAADGSASGPCTFVIAPQSSLQTISRDLEEKGLVRSALAFRVLTRFAGAERSLRAGTYRLSAHAWPWQHLRELEGAQVATVQVTVPEGLTLRELARLVEQAGVTPAGELVAAARDPGLLQKLDVPGPSAEGYLFPDTYVFAPGVQAREVVETMVRQFFAHLGAIAGAAELSRDELAERVILASIVEKEARDVSELERIAGVFHNRMTRNMKLESCATVQYTLERPKERLTLADVRRPSPYNTYLHPGLPPGPIANPGVAALRAAFAPERHDLLFFFAKDDGTHQHVFSRTYEEHRAEQRLLVKLAQR